MEKQEFLEAKDIYEELEEAELRDKHIKNVKAGEGELVVKVSACKTLNGKLSTYEASVSLSGSTAQTVFDMFENWSNNRLNKLKNDLAAL